MNTFVVMDLNSQECTLAVMKKKKTWSYIQSTEEYIFQLAPYSLKYILEYVPSVV